MSQRFVRCAHCGLPHALDESVCPITGRPIEARKARPANIAISPHPTRPGLGNAPQAPQRPSAPMAAAPRISSNPPPFEGLGTAPPPPLIGQVLGGKYRAIRVLGEGGMGTVYECEHVALHRKVAVKVLHPAQAKKKASVARFQNEAHVAGAIGHPNICEIYVMGEIEDGSPFLVMELLQGETLAERIASEGAMPFDDIIDVISQVLSGLVAAHDKGIIHRDIKPENIFLARRVGAAPIIKLLDFGVSKMLPEFQTSEDALDLTRTGMVMGTPYYMSPEQARGERNLDGRVDVYACGVVLYEAIAGKRPFLAPNYNALLLAIINTNPRPLREVRPNTPPELEAIIQHAMAKNRNDRYASAKLFLRDLQPPAAEPSASRLPPPPTAEERARAQHLGGQRIRRDTGPTDPRQRRIPEAPPSRPVPPPPGSRPSVVSDSIEIPIDFVPDDDATAIYQPKPRHPTPRWTEQDPPRAAPPPPRSNRHLDVPPAPPEPSGPYIDEVPTEVPPGRSSRRAPLPGQFNPDETVKLTKTGEETFHEQRRSPRRR